MAKNPILPLYYNDILGATKTWTDEEFGAYLRLLIEQWDKGGLPKDYQRLTRLATSLDTNWPMLKEKFVEIEGVLKNRNMEAIREKRVKHSEKQAENVRNRYQKSTKQVTKNTPLEYENENENEKIIEKGIVELRLDSALDERTIEILKMSKAYPGVDIDQQAAQFRLKVTNSPRVYEGHDTEGLRLAFNAQLRSAVRAEKPKTERVSLI